MALTHEESRLIRETFDLVARDRRQAAACFYQALFEEAPETRALFVNDLERQGAELMSKLGLIVTEVQNIKELPPFLEDLALRHVAYGVKPEHYPPVGRALLRMLEETLGEAFTPAARAAWTKAYDDISALMINSAYSHEAKIAAL